MVKLAIVLCSALFLQLGTCEVRDYRHVPKQIEIIRADVTSAGTELEAVDVTKPDEVEIIRATSVDFVGDLEEAVTRLKRAVKNNARNNEQGKLLQNEAEQTHHLLLWSETNLKGDANSLKTNFKLLLNNFVKLVPDFPNLLAHAKESTDNNELAINSMTDTLDQAMFAFKKVLYHLKFRKFTNKQLISNINEVLQEAYVSLQGLPDDRYTINELVTHAHHLDHYIERLVARLNAWAKNQKGAKLITATEHFIAELRQVQAGIKQHARANKSLASIKTAYKLWLGALSTQLGTILGYAHDESIVRAVLYDGVGISMIHKQVFKVLAEKKFQ